MGLFSRSKPEPVRREQVRELLKLGMKESDALDRDLDLNSKEFDQAKAAFERAAKVSTRAEIKAAHEALQRHGY